MMDVKRQDHYTRLPIQPIEYILENSMEYWRGNIIKYASRAGYKNYQNMGLEESAILDLQKAIHYCEMQISQIKGERYDGQPRQNESSTGSGEQSSAGTFGGDASPEREAY
jgi:hypothetical protein